MARVVYLLLVYRSSPTYLLTGMMERLLGICLGDEKRLVHRMSYQLVLCFDIRLDRSLHEKDDVLMVAPDSGTGTLSQGPGMH